MTTYYVKTAANGGSDAANGTSYATAFATLGKLLGAAGMSSGDTAYVAPGTYREVVTVAMTSAIATTSIIADVDGSHTDGVGGDVIWTAYTTNDTSAPSASPLITVNGKSYLSFQKFTLIGGTDTIVTASSGGTNWSFTDCVFMHGAEATNVAVSHTVTVDVPAVWRYTRCWFYKHNAAQALMGITAPTSTTADYDVDIVLESCLISGQWSDVASLATSGANTFKPGGFQINRCTGFLSSVTIIAPANWSQTKPALCTNSYFTNGTAAAFTVNAAGTVVEEDNRFAGGGSNGATVAGTNTVVNSAFAPAMEFSRDILSGRLSRHPYTPSTASPMLGFGNVEVAVRSVGTVADDATVGSVAWSTASNATYPDTTNYAVTGNIAQNALSHYLKCTNFGFNIPSTATIVGVRVDIKQLASASSSVSLNGNGAGGKLVKAGVIGGSAVTSATNWPASDGFAINLGGVSNLWGNTLTYTDINDSGFGVAFAVTNSNAATRTASVDYVRIAVFYTDTAAGTTDVLNRPRPIPTLRAIGALERHDTAVVETGANADGGSGGCYRIDGPGNHDIRVPVPASATTVTVKVKWDANHGDTNKPQATLVANNTIGVSSSTATAAGTAGGSYETLTLGPFTPTAKGVVKVRLISRSAASNGKCWFDTLAVS